MPQVSKSTLLGCFAGIIVLLSMYYYYTGIPPGMAHASPDRLGHAPPCGGLGALGGPWGPTGALGALTGGRLGHRSLDEASLKVD